MKRYGGIRYESRTPEPGTADHLRFVNVAPDRCIGCGNCESVCPTAAIVGKNNRRWSTRHIPDPDRCIHCGQCLVNCPVAAIYEEVSFVEPVRKALADTGTLTVALPAPSIRYALAEEFGEEPGGYSGGKMFAALKALGFDVLWDVQFGADVTIMEEGAELAGRLSGGLDRPLPQFTSCCPGWIRYVETYYPDLIPHLSSTMTPTQINGALAKTYGAETLGADPARMYTVSIMPCVSKKFEGLRAEHETQGHRNVDATIDTRELAAMIAEAGIDFAALPEVEPHELMGTSSGGGAIFGVTGGVMEAMLRRLAVLLDGNEDVPLEFKSVRGRNGIREATITAGGRDLKVAVVSGLKNAAPVCEAIRRGEGGYTAVEVMACPGGCVNGGGQPYVDWSKRPVFSTLFNLKTFCDVRMNAAVRG